jgi:hypothetical protein
VNTRHSIYTEDSFENRQEPQPILASIPILETDFAESEDGSLIEMIEDPNNSSRSLLAVWKDGVVHIADRFRCRDRILVPIPRNQHIIKHVRFPQGVESCVSVKAVLARMHRIFSECLDLSVEYICLLSFFVLSTWLIEQLPVAPYLALVGLPRSGKSTALSVLRLLCRSALLTTDITAAAFYRACERLTPTLLIDETGTAGEQRTLLHLLRTGTTRDGIALRKNESFNTFGAKVVSWADLPDDAALNSRCVIIPTNETHRINLTKPFSPEIVQAADAVQKQLLQLRFEKYKTLSLPKFPGDEKLYSRTRDLCIAFALPVAEITESCEWLVKNFTSQQKSGREPLSPRQATVLQYLFDAIHERPGAYAWIIQDLTNQLNRYIRQTREPDRTDFLYQGE